MRNVRRPVRWDVTLPVVAMALIAVLVAACEAGPPPVTPTPRAGTPEAPREVNLVAKDYSFLPATLDLIPGETVLLHIVNGGLEIHEAVFGDQQVQDAWEIAEAATAGSPPGATPVVSVAPAVAGLRVVVRSGERVDIRWTVPNGLSANPGPTDWIVGCHIPGHMASGMWIPVRWIAEPAS